MLFRRQKLLDPFYRRLPENKKKILTSKKVISIDSHAQGVKVRCDDGSIEEGSIVIGCDGVHSIVRGMMRELALKSSAETVNVERPMAAQYQLLAGHICRIPNLEPKRLWEIRNNASSMQIFMLED